jgi:uncharacterized protein YjbI with pentapeptide repeats
LTVALLAGALAGFGAFVILAYRRQWHWTGLPAPPDASAGAEDRGAKTLWDWLQLLGIPVALAVLAFALNDAQSNRDQLREDQREMQQRRFEGRRAAQQRATAVDAERENILRTYLAQVSDLMLDRRLLRSKPGANVRNVARTATLTAVRRLDGPRRGLMVKFLAEARLLRRKGASGIVRIDSADLRGADLRDAILIRADLNRVNLTGADLSEAYLLRVHLRQTNLSRANLSEAYLSEGDLRLANLSRADLSRADLTATELGHADLSSANLSRADLSSADLSRADLRRANLSKANLSGANLLRAKLSGANLSGASGIDMTGSQGKPALGP